MKKLLFFTFAIIIAAAAFISSCSYNPNSATPITARMDFHTTFHGNYDVFFVDTADASGNNPDIIIRDSTKITVQDIVSDTSLHFAGLYPVVEIKTYQVVINQGIRKLIDSSFFYQDPNGDLYRYNFGFSLLNQNAYLVAFIGSNVDVGWVLAAKMSSSTGTTWIAKQTVDTIQSTGSPINLTSSGVMMADTSFLVGSQTIKARHARNTVTASTVGINETGTVVLDSYYSTDINAVVCDFFRHVKLSGGLLNQQEQGRYKILTSFTP